DRGERQAVLVERRIEHAHRRIGVTLVGLPHLRFPRVSWSSGLTLPVRMTLPQTSESRLMKATESSRDRVAGCRPLSSYFFLIAPQPHRGWGHRAGRHSCS